MNKFLMLIVGSILAVAVVDKSHAQVAHVTYFAPAPVWVAPAPVQVTSFFAPAPVVTYQRVPVARTRYRPILGGTVTRYRTALAPVVVTPTPVWVGF
ncbi:hypothetical protein [Bythopirellula polymerisocia]|uniref:Uncharacterized protein n=1 Tax=Bythopirellula polymerisocia TaxID=2528003 RepID=A0A5C6CML0_9BACT|nr:hypothetical protein [Bythopirellula polymerisocia]TWU24704.1 hypothetical protein Pla144_35900 [Bythopirellula polymerisocia]